MFPEHELPGFRVERALPVDVEAAWAAMAAVIGSSLCEVGGEHSFALDEWALTERTTAVSPPSRRVYEIVSGAPVARYEGTTTFEPGGPGVAVLRWQIVVEPAGEEPFEAFLARAELAVTRGIDAIAARCARSGT